MPPIISKRMSFPREQKEQTTVSLWLYEIFLNAGWDARKCDPLNFAVMACFRHLASYVPEDRTQQPPIDIAVEIDEVRFKAKIMDPFCAFGSVEPVETEMNADGIELHAIRTFVDELRITYQEGFLSEFELIRFI